MVVEKDVDFSDYTTQHIYKSCSTSSACVSSMRTAVDPHGVVVVGTFDCDVRHETKIHL